MAAEAGHGPRGVLSDALRAQLATSLERRATETQGRVRMLIEARVATLRQPTSAANASSCAAGDPWAAHERPGRSALQALAAQCARQAPLHPTATATAATTATATAADPRPELKSLRLFRSTWTRLAAERRLAQSQAALPDKAGPLNSHLLVHRALTLMQDTSPEYLHHFMAYVETLMRLEPMPAAVAAASSAKDKPAPKGSRKPRRNA